MAIFTATGATGTTVSPTLPQESGTLLHATGGGGFVTFQLSGGFEGAMTTSFSIRLRVTNPESIAAGDVELPPGINTFGVPVAAVGVIFVGMTFPEITSTSIVVHSQPAGPVLSAHLSTSPGDFLVPVVGVDQPEGALPEGVYEFTLTVNWAPTSGVDVGLATGGDSADFYIVSWTAEGGASPSVTFSNARFVGSNLESTVSSVLPGERWRLRFDYELVEGAYTATRQLQLTGAGYLGDPDQLFVWPDDDDDWTNYSGTEVAESGFFTLLGIGETRALDYGAENHGQSYTGKAIISGLATTPGSVTLTLSDAWNGVPLDAGDE